LISINTRKTGKPLQMKVNSQKVEVGKLGKEYLTILKTVHSEHFFPQQLRLKNVKLIKSLKKKNNLLIMTDSSLLGNVLLTSQEQREKHQKLTS
jgi:hypothetical protein